MSTLAESTDLVLSEPFYAPSEDGALDTLLARRDRLAEAIAAVASGLDGDAKLAIGYFLAGAKAKQGHCPISVSDLLVVPPALAALDADCWQQAMKLTDVYDCMPQARRDEWTQAIERHQTPPFTADHVIPTFQTLLSSRQQFFAERVDGIFRALSRSHVTNRPEGFGKRMIIPYAWRGNYPDTSTCGCINDLRAVVARFMGRDEPPWRSTSHVVAHAADHARKGKWVTLDGGALRIRVYRGIGTAHLEVHPDMAWRLNGVLASLHPQAIPASMRERPKVVKLREFRLLQKPLPFQVLEILGAMPCDSEWTTDRFGEHRRSNVLRNTRKYPYDVDMDKATRRQVEGVLGAIGGAEDGGIWRFDYDPGEVLAEILCSGCIPDQASHQFYPTPEALAQEVVAAAGLAAGMRVLEPSAGQGGLADLLPPDAVCVEVSALHCQILRSKGREPICADFTTWRDGMFDRVVMNPPFSEGRWRAHLKHAASMVRPGGRLVAILPESARGKGQLPGWTERWGEVHRGAFPGTSVAVSILTADRPR